MRFSCDRFSKASPWGACVVVEPGVCWDMVNLIIHRSVLRGAPVPPQHPAACAASGIGWSRADRKSCSEIHTNA